MLHALLRATQVLNGNVFSLSELQSHIETTPALVSILTIQENHVQQGITSGKC